MKKQNSEEVKKMGRRGKKSIFIVRMLKARFLDCLVINRCVTLAFVALPHVPPTQTPTHIQPRPDPLSSLPPFLLISPPPFTHQSLPSLSPLPYPPALPLRVLAKEGDACNCSSLDREISREWEAAGLNGWCGRWQVTRTGSHSIPHLLLITHLPSTAPPPALPALPPAPLFIRVARLLVFFYYFYVCLSVCLIRAQMFLHTNPKLILLANFTYASTPSSSQSEGDRMSIFPVVVITGTKGDRFRILFRPMGRMPYSKWKYMLLILCILYINFICKITGKNFYYTLNEVSDVAVMKCLSPGKDVVIPKGTRDQSAKTGIHKG